MAKYEVITLEETAHSHVGPSSIERAINCSASVVLAEQATVVDTSPGAFAQEGTIAHALLETCLTTNTMPWEWVGAEVRSKGEVIDIISEEMANTMDPVVIWVEDNLGREGLWVEERLELPGTPIFGTAD